MNYRLKIRDLREDADMTQTEIAKILGTNQKVYSRYETEVNTIPIWHLVTLAKFYQTSTDYLLGLTDQRYPYPPPHRGH